MTLSFLSFDVKEALLNLLLIVHAVQVCDATGDAIKSISLAHKNQSKTS
jgi:hypothetical protein